MNTLYLQSTINICLESAAALFLAILLFACNSQKGKTPSMNAFIHFALAEELLLLCQVIEWEDVILVYYGDPTPLVLFTRVFFFVAEYWIEFIQFSIYFRYCAAYIDELGQNRGKPRRQVKPIWTFFKGLTVGVLLLYTSSLWTGWLFRFDKAGHITYLPVHFLVSGIASLVWCMMILWYILRNRRILEPQETLVLSIYTVVPPTLIILDAALNTCFGYLSVAFIIFVVYFRVDVKHYQTNLHREMELAKKDAEMTNMQVKLMMSQIQPHFLYNSLSAIAYLCTENPKEAERATNEFANYLRTNLRSINSQTPIPFTAELNHVRNYLRLEKRRFMDQMLVEYHIETDDFLIPALALQPLVENAVHYGVEARYEPTTIVVSSRETDTRFLVTVEDDGPGFDPTKPLSEERLHIGINSVRSRLAEMVGGTLTIESQQGKGTRATITIPKKRS